MFEKSKPFPLSRASDHTKLFKWVLNAVTDADLKAIAASDYGADIPQHLNGLRNIVRNHELPDMSKWHPGEVIELSRWATVPHDAPPEKALSIHLQRLFCCTVLFMIDGEHKGSVIGIEPMLAQLIESLEAFHPDIAIYASDMVLWLLQNSDCYRLEELGCMGIALLHLAIANPSWSNEELVRVVEWLDDLDNAEMAELRDRYGYRNFPKTWLLEREEWDRCDKRWLMLANNLPTKLSDRHSDELIDWINLIAAMLHPDPFASMKG